MKRILLPILVLACIHQVAQYIARPLVSLLASDLGAGNVQIGLVAGAFSVIQLALALAAGRLADRAGGRTAALLGSAALVVGLAGLPFARNWVQLLLLQVLAGFAHLYVQVAYQSLVTTLYTGTERENNVGLLTFIISVGQSVGPLLGGLIDEKAGMAASFTVATAVAAAGLAVAFLLPRPRTVRADGGRIAGSGSTWTLLRTPAVSGAIFTGVAVLFATDVLTTYFPLYGQEIGLSSAAIGLALSIRYAATMAVRPFMGTITRWVGRTAVVVGSLAFGGLFIAFYGFWTAPLIVMAVSAVTGAAIGLAQPMTIVLVSEATAEEQRGQALALRLMGNRLGQSVSPILFGFLATGLGLAPVFWISGAVLAVSARFGLPPRVTCVTVSERKI